MNLRKEIIGDCTLYLGDCREVMPALEGVDAVITDPVWPNCPLNSVPGSDRPTELFAEASEHMRRARRVVVHLGCDSDPAMLAALRLPFLRVCWLEYACPSYKGRLLATGDVAYCYGEWPKSREGARVIPGKCVSTISDKEFVRGPRRPGKEMGGYEALAHPMPRRLQFVRWLCHWWSGHGETVVDPFMGSGTAGVACAKIGRRFTGIEVDEGYFDIACRRIEEAYRQSDLIVAAERQEWEQTDFLEAQA